MVFGQLWGGEEKKWLFFKASLNNVINSTMYEIEGQHLAAAACQIQTHESGRARHKNSFDIKQTKINITKHVLAARCDGGRNIWKYLDYKKHQRSCGLWNGRQVGHRLIQHDMIWYHLGHFLHFLVGNRHFQASCLAYNNVFPVWGHHLLIYRANISCRQLIFVKAGSPLPSKSKTHSLQLS